MGSLLHLGVLAPRLRSVCCGPVSCPGSLPLGPRSSMWVGSWFPRLQPGWQVLMGEESTGLSGQSCQACKEQEHCSWEQWSLEVCKARVWGSPQEAAHDLQPWWRSPWEAPVIPIQSKYSLLSSAVVRMRPWVPSGPGQVWRMPIRWVCSGYLQAPCIVSGGYINSLSGRELDLWAVWGVPDHGCCLAFASRSQPLLSPESLDLSFGITRKP